MSLNELSSTGRAVTAAIQLASAHSGIDFSYLLAQAKAESGLDPNARAATSSASGLYQFTRGTWLETIRKHGAANGLGWAATVVADGSAAHDPAVRTAVLDLRRDPVASAAMAAAYAADNAAKLAAGLGHAASSAELYMAHFPGAAGALRFLKAKAIDPGEIAATIAPAAAQANRAVFFAPDDSPRSLAAVYDLFANKFNGEVVPRSGTTLPAKRLLPPAQFASASAAHTAYLLLAELSA